MEVDYVFDKTGVIDAKLAVCGCTLMILTINLNTLATDNCQLLSHLLANDFTQKILYYLTALHNSRTRSASYPFCKRNC